MIRPDCESCGDCCTANRRDCVVSNSTDNQMGGALLSDIPAVLLDSIRHRQDQAVHNLVTASMCCICTLGMCVQQGVLLQVYHVRNKMDKVGLDMLLDIHGDEELPYNFINGNEVINNMTGCSWSACVIKQSSPLCHQQCNSILFMHAADCRSSTHTLCCTVIMSPGASLYSKNHWILCKAGTQDCGQDHHLCLPASWLAGYSNCGMHIEFQV